LNVNQCVSFSTSN